MKIFRQILICSLVLLLLPCCLKAAADLIPATVSEAVRERVDEGYCVGIVVGMLNPQGREYFAYGHSDAGRKQQIDSNTVFEIGSVTKVYTTLALALMAAQGTVSLDEPVAALLPAGVTVPTLDGQQILLHHLAEHSSGLPRLPTNLAPADPNDPYADYDADRLYTFLGGHSLARAPGAAYEYSNLGSGLLGFALSRKIGKQFAALIRELICVPLGMKRTLIDESRLPDNNKAIGHAASRRLNDWHFDVIAGAGALRSTAGDQLRFLAAQLGLWESDLYAAMKTTHDLRFEVNERLKVGLGWHVTVNETGARRMYWHNGATGGFHSFVGFDPIEQTAVVVLCNSKFSIDDIGVHALWPEQKIAALPKTIAVERAILESYVGVYQLMPTFLITIRLEEDALTAQATGQEPFRIYPKSTSRFFYKVVEAEIEFESDQEGSVSGLTLFQGGRSVPAEKIK